MIALKVIKRKLMKGNQIDLLRKEAELLQSINHENIVKFKHVSINTFLVELSL